MKLWGLVAEVNDKDLVVSLPGGLRGLVHASDAYDPIFSDKNEVCIKFFLLRYPFHMPRPLMIHFLVMVQCYFPLLLTVSKLYSSLSSLGRLEKVSFLVHFGLGS